MTENETGKLSLIEEFKALNSKQWIAIVAAFAVSIFATAVGFAVSCLGFLIIAVLLYMIPHLFGVASPKIKCVNGAVFIVIILVIAAFAYSGSALSTTHVTDDNNKILKDVEYTDSKVIIYYDEPGVTFDAHYYNGMLVFGIPAYDGGSVKDLVFTYTDGKYIASVDLKTHSYYGFRIATTGDNAERVNFFVDTGMTPSEVNTLSLMSSLQVVFEIALVYFVMLFFSELMRRSARKTRDKMEKDGRLYPKGYSKCKECGALVLPGEITCRKCGAAIEVPEDIKKLHKKDFFECSECGTEVPMDAKICPKCGAVFDEKDEVEIKHVDGTVDVSTETFECSECGKEVPANAQRCPYCGATFDEEDE